MINFITYMMQHYRKIIHIDMDCFYAAVERLDNINLAGKAIVVGHDSDRGVVSTASYEARRYGVHSAQSIRMAKRLCPNLLIIEPRFERYKEISNKIHNIFHRYTDLIEPISLDEAFLDVTQNKKGIELAVDIAKEIKAAIHDELGLTASAGGSYCKLLAKIASDYNKPDGLWGIKLHSNCIRWVYLKFGSCEINRCLPYHVCLENVGNCSMTMHVVLMIVP